MIKLKAILQEIKSKDSYDLDKAVVIPRKKVHSFFKKNLDDIKELVDLNDYDTLYQMAYEEFPDIPQDVVAQSINNEIESTKWLMKEPTMGYNEKISYDIDETSETWEIDHEVSKWVKKNKTKLIKLADADNYGKFNDMVKKAFPKAQEDKLMQALGAATVDHGIHYDMMTD